jgi:hypothetical protein
VRACRHQITSRQSVLSGNTQHRREQAQRASAPTDDRRLPVRPSARLPVRRRCCQICTRKQSPAAPRLSSPIRFVEHQSQSQSQSPSNYPPTHPPGTNNTQHTPTSTIIALHRDLCRSHACAALGPPFFLSNFLSASACASSLLLLLLLDRHVAACRRHRPAAPADPLPPRQRLCRKRSLPRDPLACSRAPQPRRRPPTRPLQPAPRPLQSRL